MGVLRAGVVLLIVASLACAVDLDLPAAVRVTCASNAECPPTTVCKTSLGRCVKTTGDDGRPPGIAESTLTPALATLGAVVTLGLVADEPLALEPEAVIGSRGVFTLVSADPGMQRFELTYEVRGTETSGTEPVSVTLVDDSGNQNQLVVGSVTLDFVAPRLGVALWQLPGAKRAVKPGDRATLVANVDNDTAVSGAVLFVDDLEVADVTDAVALAADGDAVEVRLEVQIPADTADGSLLAVGFQLVDPAGNATNPRAALTPALPVDARPPVGVLILPSTSTTASVLASLSSSDASSVRFEGDVLSPFGAQSPVPAALTLLLTDGNGTKTVTAVFEDAAGNLGSAPPATVTLAMPPGTDAPGQPCAVDGNCSSQNCACADTFCQTRRCAVDQACGVCKRVDASGVCVGNIANETQDIGGCSSPLTCGNGACFVARGEACTQASDCITGFCECKDAACSSRICANLDCAACSAGQDCSIVRNNDSPCDTGKVCRVGACVVRDPGTCTVMCPGNLTCLGLQISSACNTAQGFSAVPRGPCPSTPPCSAAPACSCL